MRERSSPSPCVSSLAADKPRCVLGIDPGLNRTGYAVIELPGAYVRDAGFISSSASRPLAERLDEIAAGIGEVLAEGNPGLLVVEDLFAHYQHPRTAILMGPARGVVLSAAARRGVDVLSVSATKIKKALTGNGHASKLQMQRAVMATLGLSKLPKPSDVADALAIACYAVCLQQRRRSLHQTSGGLCEAGAVSSHRRKPRPLANESGAQRLRRRLLTEAKGP